MFRRARLAVRPNVRPAGRGAGGAADAEPQGSPAASRDEAAAAESLPAGRRADSDEKTNSSSDAGEASKPTDMPTQRRKRISTMPNLVKPRAGPSSGPHTAAKPQRRASQAPDGSASLQKDSPPSEKGHAESSSKSPMLPEKKTPVPQVPQFSPLKKSVNKEQTVAAQKNDDTLKSIPSPLKERPTQETSVAQEEKLPPKPSPVKEKRICSDRERILKARKLREMLKEELKKERMKQLKHRPPIIEGCSPPDRSKMTMRDLIYYLPENNPMKSSLAEEKRTEKSSALGQTKEQEEKSTPDHEEEDEEEAENGEESQDGPLLVPRVKVAEDGSIILDEESLTVEVLRTKGPCVVEENDPIFERGSTTTYSSFRKSFYTKPWSNKETDMFFLAISMVGTDFSLIGRLFPHRARAEIKNKFKREEKANGWRIDKAFKEKRPFDFELFAQLLEKVLADEEKRRQKTVKSQKPKEKKPLRPRKKPKAKVANTETTDNQDGLQEARISDAETEADTVTAEKENTESLGVSEEAEEQVSLEAALVNKKRKKKRKDDLEQEVENRPEELAVTSKIAEEGKSSKKTGKKMANDTNAAGHTLCREELSSVTEEEQDDLPAKEEERSLSFISMDDVTERESDVNLCSFQDSSDKLVTEPTKLQSLGVTGDTSQESQLSEYPVSRTRSKERQLEEDRETTSTDTHGLREPEEKQNASERDSQSQIMNTEKPAERRRLQKPKPNIMKLPGKKEAVNHEKMEAETSSPNLVNITEKCSEEDSGGNRSEITEVESMDLDPKSEGPEKTVSAVARIRGSRQRFKPNLTRASGRKEHENNSENDKMSHPESKEETEKNTDQSSKFDVTDGEAAEKDDKVLEMVSQSNEAAGSQEGSKQSVLKPAPLKRGRVQKPKPNLGRTVAWKKDHRHEKDPEEEKVEGGEAEGHVIHHVNESNDTSPKNDMVGAPKKSPQKPKDVENEKGSSDVLKDVSDFNTGQSGPENQEGKTVISSIRLLRSRFHRPKPNLRATGRKEVMDINKGVSQEDTNKKESLMQSSDECCILPDTDKAENCEVLQSLESLGKQKSVGPQDVSESNSSFNSPDTLSGSEYGKVEPCLLVDNQNETSSTNAGIDREITTQGESKQTPLQPVQLVRSGFQKYKPNLGKGVRRKELQIPENNEDKKSEVDDLEVQKTESACHVSAIGKNEAALHEGNVLSNEELTQEEVPQVPCISEKLLCGQIRSNEKLSSGEESNQCDTKPSQQARVSLRNPKPNLTRAHRKRSHSEDNRNRRDEDNAETGNTEEHLLEKTGVSVKNSSNTEEAASFTESTGKHDFTDSVERPSCKRIRKISSSFQSPEIPLESESQVEQEDSQLSAPQQKILDDQTRRQSKRSSKQIILPKHGLELRTGSSSASDCEADCCEKGNQRQEVKSSVTRGKSVKTAHRKKPVKEQRSSKTSSLVTLRASQEDEEEADDFEPDDEDECFALEEVNKAPVFVPVGLRSPKPIPVQIEETMEELDISVNIPDVPVATNVEGLSYVSVQPVIQKEEKGNTLPAEATLPENPEVDKGINDGSTEAAMTLLAMGDPTFQLKANTEEWTRVLPAQDELNMASSLVSHDDSEQNRAPNQYVVSSATSAKVPCKDGSNINAEDQSTCAGTDVEEYFEKDAADARNSSLPMVNSMTLRRGSLQKSNPNTGVLRSNESVIQKPLNTNVVMEQLDSVQSESMDSRGTTEAQKVEQVSVGPTSRDTSVLQNFTTSVELVKQMDNKGRTQEEMKDVCGTSGNLSAGCEKSHLGLKDYLDESSVDRAAVQNPCPANDSQCTIRFAQNETHAQDCAQQHISSTEETSVNNYQRCPEEEEQTFILTLVEILANSEEFDTSALQEQTSEPLLPAPILISPVKSSGTGLTEVESIGSLTTAADELGEYSNSSTETKQQESASVEPVLTLVHTAQKRSAAEPAENDVPLVKKTVSTVVESNVEGPCQGYSSKSTNTQTRTPGNPSQKPGASAKENVLTSALLPVSPVDERSQCETSENSGEAPFHNLASSQEEEVTCGLTSSTKTEKSEQGKLGDEHEAAQLECTESLRESSKTPLLGKSSSESAEEMQRKKGKIPNPQIGTTKPSLKNTVPSSKDDKESCSVPSRSTSSFVEYDSVPADAVVTAPHNEPSEKPPHCSEDQEKEEEPTKISEYFFSDIFMEVDDPE